MCLYALPTMSKHAPDETAYSVLGDILQDLDYSISELLDSLWYYLVASSLRLRLELHLSHQKNGLRFDLTQKE